MPHPKLANSQVVGFEFWTDDPAAAMSWAAGSDDVLLIGLYRTNYQPAGYRCFVSLRRTDSKPAVVQDIVVGTKRHDLARDDNESKLMGFTLLAEAMPVADRFASDEQSAGTLMMATRWKVAPSLVATGSILRPPPKLFIGANWIIDKGSRKFGCWLSAEVPTPTLKRASTW